jgi:hypothetical protein
MVCQEKRGQLSIANSVRCPLSDPATERNIAFGQPLRRKSHEKVEGISSGALRYESLVYSSASKSGKI